MVYCPNAISDNISQLSITEMREVVIKLRVRAVNVCDRGHGCCVCDLEGSADASDEHIDIVLRLEVACLQ